MAEAPQARKGGGKLKLVLAVGLPLVLLLLAGGGAYLGGHLPFGPGAEAALPGAADADGQGQRQADPGNMVFVELPDVLVNLQGDGRRMRFLKMKLALEVASERDAERIRQLTPRIMDSFQLYLRSLESEELEGTAAMYRLKEDLLARINHAVRPVRVHDVLLKELLVQ